MPSDTHTPPKHASVFYGTCFAEYTLQPNKLLFVFGIFTHFCREPGESQSLEGRIVLMWCQHRSETKQNGEKIQRQTSKPNILKPLHEDELEG